MDAVTQSAKAPRSATQRYIRRRTVHSRRCKQRSSALGEARACARAFREFVELGSLLFAGGNGGTRKEDARLFRVTEWAIPVTKDSAFENAIPSHRLARRATSLRGKSDEMRNRVIPKALACNAE